MDSKVHHSTAKNRIFWLPPNSRAWLIADKSLGAHEGHTNKVRSFQDSIKGGVRTLKRIALNATRLTKLRADVSEYRVAMLRDKCAIELVQLPIHHARLCAVVGAALLMMAESISLLAPSRCLISTSSEVLLLCILTFGVVRKASTSTPQPLR